MSVTKTLPLDLTEAPPRRGLAPAWRVLFGVAGLALALAPIWVLESFQLFQLTMAVVMALAVLGLNIVSGYNGQVSLGHGAFYTLGAYTAAILMVFFSVPHWAALPVAGFVCLVAGVLFSIAASSASRR